nr:11708_t:CDS:2 [Entrophospora candida]
MIKNQNSAFFASETFELKILAILQTRAKLYRRQKVSKILISPYPVEMSRGTGSSSWPQFTKVTNQVIRLDVRCTVYCERPSPLRCRKVDHISKVIPGDGGIDIRGYYRNMPVEVQCKNCESVGINALRVLENVLENCHPDSIGILVAPFILELL